MESIRPHLGNVKFVPSSEALCTPPKDKGHVAHVPTCGPLVILSPTLKRWGPPRRQGRCSQAAHMWPPYDHCSQGLGIPETARLT